jgi:hypothetical protein
MTNQIDHIVEHLFHKKRLADVSIYELERFIATHPYFAAGHFLLAKKDQFDDPEHFKQKIDTAALYYNNPLWLQWLLDQDLSPISKKQDEKEPVSIYHEDTAEEQVIDSTMSADEEPAEIITHLEENNEPNEISDFSSGEPIQENEFAIVYDTEPDASAELNHDERANANQQDILTENEPDISVMQPPSEQKSEYESPNEDIGTANETEIITENNGSDNLIHLSESGAVDNPDHADKITTLENISVGQDTDLHAEPEAQNESAHAEQSSLEEQESRASAASIERTLTTAALIPTRAEIEKNEFTFEPYHTIDYFASQGIKLQQSDLSKDKFGKQLKSFTEWLKSMKRLPQAVAEANMDEATRQSIQHIAEHSFEEKEIVTETMADVWIKQGNKEKAIDTLHKLSLLNPSKSHYFAAKIEQLKAS